MVHTMHLADEELLLALDDQLPPVRVAPAQAHLATCAACRGRMQEFQQTGERLGDTSQSDDWMADALRARGPASNRDCGKGVVKTRVRRSCSGAGISLVRHLPRSCWPSASSP